MKTRTLRIRPGTPLDAEISVPGDKSISHRAAMLAALSNGPCTISNFLEAEDCLATCRVLESMGVRIERPGPGVLIVHGCGGHLEAPDAGLDCGNSGTTMRLMAGILAAQPFESRLSGDASLSKRPMQRVIGPLRQMGAAIVGTGERGFPPLMIKGNTLRAISYETPIASAQVKSAILLAGLFAHGITTVTEPAVSRDHTERLLNHFLVDVRCRKILVPGGLKPVGCAVTIPGRQVLESRDLEVPGDLSSAAFWLVAAAARPGSRLLVKKVGLNPTRTGILDVLVRMGARVREVVEETGPGEPSGLVDIRGSRLRGVTIGGGDIANVIDELPVIAVAAALAEGTTVIRDAAELRVKESDRIATVAANLRAMGVRVEETPDGMVIEGREHLEAATLPSFDDHRIAMAFAIAGLFARGTTTITDTACINTSYPDFEKTLRLFEKGGRKVRRSPRYVGTPKAGA